MIGNYVNFGVMHLYRDPAVNDCLDTCIKLVMIVKINDLLSYRKLSKAYYSFLESLSQF